MAVITDIVSASIEQMRQSIWALKNSHLDDFPHLLLKVRTLVKEQEQLQKQYANVLSKDPELSKRWKHEVDILNKILLLQKNFDDIDTHLSKIKYFDSLKEDDLAYQYIKIFDRLFKDSEKFQSIGSQLTFENPDIHFLAFHYFKRIEFLKQEVEKLPDHYPYNTLIYNRIIDNCSLSTLKKFKNSSLDITSNAFLSFLQENLEDNKCGTIEVITWGTQDEINNGLKNILRQKWHGDNVGHAALIMRIPADEHGLHLINQYCLNPNGSVKIPYDIKRYGNQVMYEIYWSFWPGTNQKIKLHTLKEDINAELGGFNYTEENEILNHIPVELKKRFVHERNRKNIRSQHEKMIVAPAAVKNIGNVEQDEKRNEYLKLKIKKLTLKDDIAALETLLENYLADGKEFSSAIKKETAIKPTSNFLVLLERFKNDLPESVQHILTKKLISKVMVIQLKKSVSKLIEDKRNETLELQGLADQLSEHLFIKKKQIKLKKKELKKSRVISSHGGELIKKQIEYSDNPIENAEEDNLFGNLFQEKMPLSSEEKDRENKALILNQMQELQNIYTQGKSVLISEKNKELMEIDQRLQGLQVNSKEWLSLKESRNQLHHELIELNLMSMQSTEDLTRKNIIRGHPTRNIMLKGFNIEEILKRGNSLLENTKEFDLKNENCSTTTFKLLRAGAPKEISSVFTASEKKAGEAYASNAFLSNPQSVYAASTIADRYNKKDKAAANLVEKSKAPPDRTYHFILNKFAAKEDNALLKEFSNLTNLFQLLWISGRALNDILPSKSGKKEKPPENDSFFKKVSEALKDKKTHQFRTIHTETAQSAIYEMMAELNENQDAIPFFSKETLKTVDEFSTSIRLKNKQSKSDKKLISLFKKIIDERNKRIDCVEKAIFDGKDSSISLRNRKKIELKWPIFDDDKINEFVANYLRNYNNIIKDKYIRLSSNIFQDISKTHPLEREKLDFIFTHIHAAKDPQVAAAWKKCLEETPLLAKDVEQIHLDLEDKNSTHFSKNKREQHLIDHNMFHLMKIIFQMESMDVSGLREEHKNELHHLAIKLDYLVRDFWANPGDRAFLTFKKNFENAVMKTKKAFEKEPGFFNNYLKPVLNRLINLLNGIASLIHIPTQYQPKLFKTNATIKWEEFELKSKLHESIKYKMK